MDNGEFIGVRAVIGSAFFTKRYEVLGVIFGEIGTGRSSVRFYKPEPKLPTNNVGPHLSALFMSSFFSQTVMSRTAGADF